MTTRTQTLAGFLLVRIAEDEEIANRSVFWEEGVRTWTDGGDATWVHIARHDPARVLAECEAKRRIVELHSQEYPHRMYGCQTCRETEEPDWPCSTLRILAQPYADHPDFREEWRA